MDKVFNYSMKGWGQINFFFGIDNSTSLELKVIMLGEVN